MYLDSIQQLGQHARAHFGAAAGALGQLGQFDVLFFHSFFLLLLFHQRTGQGQACFQHAAAHGQGFV